jgi:hypothetical protein
MTLPPEPARRGDRGLLGEDPHTVIDGGVAAAEHAAATAGGSIDEGVGESRWVPVIAILVYMVVNVALRVWLPGEAPVRVPWLLPAIEAVVVVVLVTSDPSGRVERRRLRRIALMLVGLLVAAALWATAFLVADLIRGTGVSQSARELLATGGVVWLGNNLAFALLFWLMDGGGPFARARRSIPVDFAFTQQMSPELAPPGWRPVFLDYLHLGFTNATAFSPTDVMPLTHRAKYTMLVQSTLALMLFGLIVARAVNAFT